MSGLEHILLSVAALFVFAVVLRVIYWGSIALHDYRRTRSINRLRKASVEAHEDNLTGGPKFQRYVKLLKEHNERYS